MDALVAGFVLSHGLTGFALRRLAGPIYTNDTDRWVLIPNSATSDAAVCRTRYCSLFSRCGLLVWAPLRRFPLSMPHLRSDGKHGFGRFGVFSSACHAAWFPRALVGTITHVWGQACARTSLRARCVTSPQVAKRTSHVKQAAPKEADRQLQSAPLRNVPAGPLHGLTSMRMLLRCSIWAEVNSPRAELQS